MEIFEDHALEFGEPSGAMNPAEVHRESGNFREVKLTREDLSGILMQVTPENSEETTARQSLDTSSLHFEEPRVLALEGLRKMIRYAFVRFEIPILGAFDIGSGATGAMVHDLLPPEIPREFCIESDINPAACIENQRRHPEAFIATHSYYRLNEWGMKFPLITGLSSLDCTTHLELALKSIRDQLRPGGHLLHVQDVGPSALPALEQVFHEGASYPIKSEVKRTSELPPHLLAIDAHTYWSPKDNRFVTNNELLRRRLGTAIERTPGLKLLHNEWITTVNLKPNENPSFVYSHELSAKITNDDGSANGHQKASAIVTVAQAA